MNITKDTTYDEIMATGRYQTLDKFESNLLKMSDKKVKELENEIKYAREVEQKFNSQDDEVYA